MLRESKTDTRFTEFVESLMQVHADECTSYSFAKRSSAPDCRLAGRFDEEMLLVERFVPTVSNKVH
jgi:hypothetical protein